MPTELPDARTARLARRRSYYAANREKVAAYQRKYYQANRDEWLQRDRAARKGRQRTPATAARIAAAHTLARRSATHRGTPWTPAEDAALADLCAQSLPLVEVALALGRSLDSIYMRRRRTATGSR